MWISDGEKYAIIGLQLKLDEGFISEQFAGGMSVLVDTAFHVPTEWREWLGSIRSDEMSGCNIFLVTKLKSKTPDILDDENRSLQNLVEHFYIGLLLAAIFSPSHKPVMLTGARRDGVIGIRQQSDFEIPEPQTFRPYPPIASTAIKLAAHLGQQLNTMRPDTVPGGFWRFFRTLRIYIATKPIPEILDRIHQYCRCVDGLIMSDQGAGARQFKSRTELFIGPSHHDMMGDLYAIRSNVEHLREYQYLESFDRGVRIDLLKKEAIIESIARSALARIVERKELWPHFANATALTKFWALTPEDRRKIWGHPIDAYAPVADFDPASLHDGLLGKL